MEKKSSVTVMSSSIQSDTLTGAEATPVLATHQFGAVHHLSRTQSWDPYEVWLNRVHQPRAQQGVRDAQKAQAPTIRDAGGGVNSSPLAIVRTIAR